MLWEYDRDGRIAIDNFFRREPAWGERINPTFDKRGAKYLARGGQTMLVTGSSLTEAPKRSNIIVFDSLDKAKEWDSSEDVKAARAIDRGATFRSYIVEGLPAQ
jgi:uncharacterized protein (DUF1330 family)